MQQAGGDLAAHPLTQRHPLHRLVYQRAKLEPLDQRLQPRLERRAALVVDVAKQGEGVARRQLAPQLRALAEHHPDPIGQRLALGPGRQAKHAGVARRGFENARQHLQGGRLAGAVRADDRHALAGGDLERDAVDRLDQGVVGRKGAADRAKDAAAPASVAVGLAEILDGDDGGGHGIFRLKG
jgi:hypothetical protein